jgi:ABC-type multidrug transport system ATPase subunit
MSSPACCNATLVFHDVAKMVQDLDGSVRCILHGVTGCVRCGELFAVMGLSGSGKTTLLQVLGLKAKGNITGYISTYKTGWTVGRSISYLWQDDAFYPCVQYTIRDQLIFSALVRLPSNLSYTALTSAVSQVLDQVRLQHCADTSLLWVSGGERRRTSIAKELLSKPSLLLLDEPTTGLDAAAAYDILTLLKGVATQRSIPVLCTIHQPSTRSFYLFNGVLMLCEGRCVYRGPPADCMAYLSAAGFPPPMTAGYCAYNPADYWMDLLYTLDVDPTAGVVPRYALMNAWYVHERRLLAGTADVECSGVQSTVPEQSVSETHSLLSDFNDYVTPIAYDADLYVAGESTEKQVVTGVGTARQVYAVWRRSYRANWRVQLGTVSLLQTLAMALLVGLCWYQLPQVEHRASDLAGWAFFTAAYWFFAGLYEGMLEYLPERAVLQRELQGGEYTILACFVGKTLATVPAQMILPWLYLTVAYPLISTAFNMQAYLCLTGVMILTTMTGSSIGVLIGTATTNYHLAASLTTVVSLAMLIVGGFYLQQLPSWLAELSVLSAFGYSYRAVVQVVLWGLSIHCEGGNWIPACANRATVAGAEVEMWLLRGGKEYGLAVNIAALAVFLVVFRALACASLWWQLRSTNTGGRGEGVGIVAVGTTGI